MIRRPPNGERASLLHPPGLLISCSISRSGQLHRGRLLRTTPI